MIIVFWKFFNDTTHLFNKPETAVTTCEMIDMLL